jgi:hypothetical protein
MGIETTSRHGDELRTIRMSDVLIAMDRLRDRLASQGERVWVLKNTSFWQLSADVVFETAKPDIDIANFEDVLFFLKQPEAVHDPAYPALLADVLRFIAFREERHAD